MIESLFGLFAEPWVPWALSVLLVAAAVGLWVAFRRKLARVSRALDRAIEVIEQVDGPAAFRDRFASIDAELGANPVIGDRWRAYAQSLVAVPGRDDALGATRRPASDFDQGVLGDAGINLRLYMAVPNYLVGLGLLFTFLGLVAALYFASHGVAASNVQEAQTALRHLLGAATFKFVTSIAGLGTSIVYSGREKAELHRVDRRLQRLQTALERRLVPLTPAYLGTLQLEEMTAQSALLRRVGRRLHVAVPEAVEDRLAAELIQAVQPMRAGFESAAARLKEIDQTVLERALGRLAGEGSRPSLAPLLEELRAIRLALEGEPPGRARAPEPQDAVPGELHRVVRDLATLLETSMAGLRHLEVDLARNVRDLRSALDGDARAGAGAAHADALARLDVTRAELEALGNAFRRVARSSRALLDAYDLERDDQPGQLRASLDALGLEVQRFDGQVRRFVQRIDEEVARSAARLREPESTAARRP